MTKLSIANQTVTLPSGQSIAYYDSGADTTPVVVLLHGYCGSSAYWEQVVEPLSAKARILALDLRGHGLSSGETGPDETNAMELYADDLAAMLDQLKINKACVLGHSLGGYITLAFAQRYGEKLSAFGLVHSTPLPDSDAAKENRDNAVAAIRKDGVAAFVEGLVPKLYSPDNKSAMPDQVERSIDIGKGTSAAGAIGAAKGMKIRPDRSEVLKNANLPVLLLAGEQDQIIPVERTFVIEGPNVSREKLADAGHMGMVERPEPFAEAVLRFITKLV
ncbi:Pimeloyl-ACP methyl ester carboxylesterase [Paenibacillus catalpae]|uniref:Pimeloyl-ACP methyl ester carboxylesterase n=1 Tax=Paenibacillus catalpae TaxID=1045775 RepID=A0A1I2HM93_9BACL|nr:alpha/beta hydrolase [Paenibacillus catalpae]SFF29511.1 Pimeloyl-ACP methyl ester carboxylesterase [Paenibacillus catalpae]